MTMTSSANETEGKEEQEDHFDVETTITAGSSSSSSRINNNNNKNNRRVLQHQQSSHYYDYSHTQDDPIHEQLLHDNNEIDEGGISDLVVSTFNLIASIVGGGELSVPFAFSKLGGVLWGILWMAFAAYITDQSCLMLCWSARPEYRGYSTTSTTTGSCTDFTTKKLLSSYGQVGKAAFGPIMEVAISALLFLLLAFALVAYMVLAKDVWTPIVLNALLAKQQQQYDSDSAYDDNTSNIEKMAVRKEQDAVWGPYVLLGILIVMSPFFVQHNLHALRYNCYVGFVSISILCLVLCHHAVVNVTTTTTSTFVSSAVREVWTSWDFWFAPPKSFQDVAIAFPILMLSLLCHFNINPIQKALIRPTPQRVTVVIRTAITACAVLMTLIGVGGYAYVLVNHKNNTSQHHTTSTNNLVQGNILLNVEEQLVYHGFDPWLYVGRLGCGITIMMAMAIIILPCRDSLLEVLDAALFFSSNYSCQNSNNNKNDMNKQQKQSSHATTTVEHVSEGSPLLFDDTSTSKGSNNNTTLNGRLSLSERSSVHYSSTVLIATVCYISAVKVPGVAIVWSLCGSSMAFSTAFILPAACYLEMVYYRHRQAALDPACITIDETIRHPSKAFALVLFVTSIIAAIFCTVQTVRSIL